MPGTKKPTRTYADRIWQEQMQQRAQIKACMDAVEKLAAMVQVLSQAYARIISRAQASAAADAEAGQVPETVSEGGIILGGKQP